MKTLLSLLLLCTLSPVALAQGGGLSDLLRSVTGAVSGKETAAPAQKGQTAVLGVRGSTRAMPKPRRRPPATPGCLRAGPSGARKPKPPRRGADLRHDR